MLKPQKLSSMDYYDRPEVSNSDLSALKAYLECADRNFTGKEHFLYFGNLFDAMLTEPERISLSKKTFDGQPVSERDWNLALRMKKSFLKDPFARHVAQNSGKQTVIIDDVKLYYSGMPFTLKMRCKLDFDLSPINLISDLKSTSAASQEQFEAAIENFDYDRQAAVYMTLGKVDRYAILGVSKKNSKLFKVFINKESQLYQSGMEKFKELAFKWWTLFC